MSQTGSFDMNAQYEEAQRRRGQSARNRQADSYAASQKAQKQEQDRQNNIARRDQSGINWKGWGSGTDLRPEFVGSNFQDYYDYMGRFSPYDPMMTEEEFQSKLPKTYSQFSFDPTSRHALSKTGIQSDAGGNWTGIDRSAGPFDDPYAHFQSGSTGGTGSSGYGTGGGIGLSGGDPGLSAYDKNLGYRGVTGEPGGGLDTQFWKDFSETGRLNQGLLGDIQKLEAAPNLATGTKFGDTFRTNLGRAEDIQGDIRGLSFDRGLLEDLKKLEAGSFGADQNLLNAQGRLGGLNSGVDDLSQRLPSALDLSEQFTQLRDLRTAITDTKGPDFDRSFNLLDILKGRIGGLGSQTPTGLQDIQKLIGGAQEQITGLGKLDPLLFKDLETKIGDLQGKVSRMGELPTGLEGIGTEIGGLQDLVTGLGQGEITPDFTTTQGVIDALGADVKGLGDLDAGFGKDGGIHQRISGLQSLVRGLGGLDPKLGDIGTEIGGLEGRIGGLGRVDPEQFSEFGSKIGGLEGLIGGLGRVDPEQFSEFESKIGGLEGLIGGLGRVDPEQFSEFESKIGGLEGLIGGLGRVDPEQFSEFESKIGGLEGLIGGLGRVDPEQFSEFESKIGGLEGLIGGLGRVDPEQFSEFESKIGGLEGLIGGLGEGPTPTGLQSILDLVGQAGTDIGGLETRMGKLGDFRDLGLAPADIGGLETRMGKLGDFRDLGLAPADIGGLETRMGKLGDFRDLGLAPADIGGLETRMGKLGDFRDLGLAPADIGRLETRMGKLGDFDPEQFSEFESKIGGLERRIGGLGEGPTPTGLQSIIDLIGSDALKPPDYGGPLDQAKSISNLLSGTTAPELGGIQSGLDKIGGQANRIGKELAGIIPPDRFTQQQLLSLFPEVAASQLNLPGEDQILNELGLTDQSGNYTGTGDAGKATQGGGGISAEQYQALLDAVLANQGGGEGQAPAADPQSTEGFMAQLQGILSGLAGADPMNVDQLRGDPLTAGLLSDLQKETTQADKDRTEQLQRMGVIRSGDNVETAYDLDEARLRAEYDILGQGAERARGDRDTGLSRGLDLAGLASDRELSIAEMLGKFGDDKTIGGRQADMDVIASLLAALDPELSLNRGVNVGGLADAILGTSGFSDQDRVLFSDAFGISNAGQGSGEGTSGVESGVVIDGGEITTGTGDDNLDKALNAFLQANPDIASGKYFIEDGKMINSVGGTVATWDPIDIKWKRKN